MTDNPSQSLYCYVHPQRETLLRCNRCELPICQSCAVLTPTGYRCKECVRGQQKIFDTARWWDYPLAALTAGVLGYMGSLIASALGFFILLLAPVAGMIIAEAVRFVVRRRRSKPLPWLAAGAALLGALISPLFTLILLLLSGQVGIGLISLLWPGIFAFLAASMVYYRLKGIRI
jgi:hypothetical protein